MNHRHLFQCRFPYLHCFQRSTHKSFATLAYLPVDFNSLLNTITHNAYWKCGAQAHAQILTNGFLSHSFLVNGLINMYAKCGLLEESLTIFNANLQKNVVSWTTIISYLSQSGRSLDALSFFSGMRQAGVWPNQFTFSAILPTFSDIEWLRCGQQVQSLIYKSGFLSDVFVSSALAHMYLKCMEIPDAWKVFDEMPERNLASWNTMIVGCNQNGMGKEAFEFFLGVLREGMVPDQVGFSSILRTCASERSLSFGNQIHVPALKLGLETLPVVGNALIDMYSKCGSLQDSLKLFKSSSCRDVVTWNIMMMSWYQSQKFEEACKHFLMMRDDGIMADEVTFSAVLQASASLSALDQGSAIHSQVVISGYSSSTCIVSSLITIYAKCGSLSDAYHVFEDTKDRNVVIWTAMISACQLHGHCNEVIELFEDMVSEGIKPDYITFVCLLSACSHNGLVKQGFHYFDSMSQDHGLSPGYEHYACMVDLLGRTGCLNDAKHFIESMPVEPDASVWGALLGACRTFGNLEIAKEAAEKLFEIEPHNAGNYVLLANMYMHKGLSKEADNIRKMMTERGVRKTTSCSWIEAKNITHVFTVWDKSHAKTPEIYERVGKLVELVREKGYVEDTQFAINDVGESNKEQSLWYHSEKLALAFGLITIPSSAIIRIKKNLRACGDCHTFMKLVSEVLQREIIIRDVNRFHRFKNGVCSCKDFW